MNNRNCVIVFSQSDYLINSAGTEKFISEVGALFHKQNILMLQLFPVIVHGVNSIGINFDGKYYGICKKNQAEESLYHIAKKKSLSYCGIHLQHILGWDKKYLSHVLKNLLLPIIVFVHDTYMICPKLSAADGGLYRECCFQVQAPSKTLCKDCKYSEIGSIEYNNNRILLEENSSKIIRIIAPSNVALSNWLSVYGAYREKVLVRAHLSYKMGRFKRQRNKKTRIAFLGLHKNTKGYDAWKKIVNTLSAEDYEFYCFSKRPSEQDKVQSIYVNFNDTQSKSMTELLREKNIDIVFLWSIVQETYSYTYYEASEAGCYVITNIKSGNIEAQTRINNNGMVFDNTDQCVKWLLNTDDVNAALSDFLENGMIPHDVEANKSIAELSFQKKDDNTVAIHEKRAKNINLYLTVIYYMKSRVRVYLIKGYTCMRRCKAVYKKR